MPIPSNSEELLILMEMGGGLNSDLKNPLYDTKLKDLSSEKSLAGFRISGIWKNYKN